jgi:hypothetical protein
MGDQWGCPVVQCRQIHSRVGRAWTRLLVVWVSQRKTPELVLPIAQCYLVKLTSDCPRLFATLISKIANVCSLTRSFGKWAFGASAEGYETNGIYRHEEILALKESVANLYILSASIANLRNVCIYILMNFDYIIWVIIQFSNLSRNTRCTSSWLSLGKELRLCPAWILNKGIFVQFLKQERSSRC